MKKFNNNVIEKAPSYHNLSETCYLPHKPVIQHDKAITVLRIVFGASAKVDGLPSLNDCLYVNPFLTSSLFGVFLLFRANDIAVVGELAKVFHKLADAQRIVM